MRNLVIFAALFSCTVTGQSAAQAGRIIEEVICTAEVRQTSGWRLTQVAFYSPVHKVVYAPKIYEVLTQSWKDRLASQGYVQTPGTYAGCHKYVAGTPLGGNVAPNPVKVDWSPPSQTLP